MFPIVCSHCGESCGTQGDFSSHLRKKHALTEKKYFPQMISKKDKLTGEDIPFKSVDQYLFDEFCSGKNMNAWMKKASPQERKDFCAQQLKKLANLKGVECFPSCVELRVTKGIPALSYFLAAFGVAGIQELCDDIDLKLRYSLDKASLDGLLNKNELKFDTIKCDSREQKLLKFSKDIKTIVQKLDYGDYSCDEILSVERKSLNDLLGTLSAGYERFEREIHRAQTKNGYIVVLTECNLNDFLSFNYGHQSRYTKVTPDFIFHRLRALTKNYPDSIQFAFSGGRRESAKLIPLLLAMGDDKVKMLDVQYCIANKLFDI